jgi:hypothetical protein
MEHCLYRSNTAAPARVVTLIRKCDTNSCDSTSSITGLRPVAALLSDDKAHEREVLPNGKAKSRQMSESGETCGWRGVYGTGCIPAVKLL